MAVTRVDNVLPLSQVSSPSSHSRHHRCTLLAQLKHKGYFFILLPRNTNLCVESVYAPLHILSK